jgi:alpha-glucosidase
MRSRSSHDRIPKSHEDSRYRFAIDHPRAARHRDLFFGLDVTSPDGRVVLNFAVKDFAGAKACPVYRVSYQGRPILTDSRLGFELTNGPLMEGFEIVGQTESRVETQWKPVYGERSVIHDRHQQIIVELREKAPPRRRVQVILRAYNGGAAFCYTLPTLEGWNRIEIA